MGFRPEEKGIKTNSQVHHASSKRMGFRPEEKGIKTVRPSCPAHGAGVGMGFRPEEKGIKTDLSESIVACKTDGIPT